jgi:hypothetical protein
MAIVDRLAAAQLDPPRVAIDPDCVRAAAQLDPMIWEEGFGPERHSMNVNLALEKGLRQRRPLIGKLALVGQKNNFFLETVLA